MIKSRRTRQVERMAYIWKFPRKFESENVRGRDHLRLVGRIILKWMLHFCENNNEYLCSTNVRLVDQLSMYPFLVDCSV